MTSAIVMLFVLLLGSVGPLLACVAARAVVRWIERDRPLNRLNASEWVMAGAEGPDRRACHVIDLELDVFGEVRSLDLLGYAQRWMPERLPPEQRPEPQHAPSGSPNTRAV